MNSSATEADQREFLLIEAFRGFAAFLVVYTHFWALSPGSPSLLRFAHTGVDLFFCLEWLCVWPLFFRKIDRHIKYLCGDAGILDKAILSHLSAVLACPLRLLR